MIISVGSKKAVLLLVKHTRIQYSIKLKLRVSEEFEETFYIVIL